MIKLLYFAALVDLLGTAAEEIKLAPGIHNIEGVISLLRQRGGAWEEVFGKHSVRIALNKKFVDLSAPVTDGDEIAFISAWV